MNWRVSILGILAAAAVAGGQGAAVRPAEDANASWDSYRVLMTRNIFMQDRSRPPAPTAAPSRSTYYAPPPPAAPGAQRALALTGIAQSGPKRVAFLEDTRTGDIVRAFPGDASLTGKGASHSVKNDGKEDLEIIAMIACYPPAPCCG